MSRKSSNRVWWLMGGVLVALVGGLLVAKQAGWIGQEKPEEVEIITVGNSSIIEKVSASGKIQPEVEVKLSPDVSGEITELYVAEGDSVVKGQILLKIRPDNYQSQMARAQATVDANKANMEQARASLAQAEARMLRTKTAFERSQKLFEDKVIPASEFEQASADYNVARKDVDAAQANIQAAQYNIKGAEASRQDAAENLRKTTIFAPVSGIISLLKVEVGERVVGTSQMAGTEMLRIANMDDMEVRVNVNENDIVRLSLGDTADIEVDAYGGQKFKGVVREIANTANSLINATTTTTSAETVTEFEVRVKLLRESYADLKTKKGGKYPFKPGMTAAVDIITEKKLGVLSVPIAAVITRDQAAPVGEGEENGAKEKDTSKEKIQEIVFVEKDGVIEERPVTTGISDFENIEIIKGVSKGERVVSGPYIAVSKRLKAGDKVVEKSKDTKKIEGTTK